MGLPSVERWPASSSHTWEESDIGADTMRIGADEPNGCEAVRTACTEDGGTDCMACTYYIGVRAWSETTLTITAVVEDEQQTVALREGVPYQVLWRVG